MSALALSFAAGLLTTASPCVLPVLPLVVGGAGRSARTGPLLLVLGMMTSFVTLGLALARLGGALPPETVRNTAAVLLAAFGLLLLWGRGREFLEGRLAGLSSGASALSRRLGSEGWGTFATGALLGAIWSPCAGPALGAAVALAATEGGLDAAFWRMLAYASGAAVPLLAIGYGARGLFKSHRERILRWSERGRAVFGGLLLATGAMILLGVDKRLESRFLDLAPEGWVDLVTRF